MRDVRFDMSLEEFCSLAGSARPAIIQLCSTAKASCTPFQLYSILKDSNASTCRFSYLLESVEKEQRHARFSFVGSDPEAVITVKNRAVSLGYRSRTPIIEHIGKNLAGICNIQDIGRTLQGNIKAGFDTLDALRAAFPANGAAVHVNTSFDRQTFLGGAIGFVAYDLIYDCWLERPAAHVSEFPDAQFALVGKTVVFDHLTDLVHVIMMPFISEHDDAESVYHHALEDAGNILDLLKKAESVRSDDKGEHAGFNETVCNMDKYQYEQAVSRAIRHIIDGDIFQVVPSRRYELTTPMSPQQVYQRLRDVNPSPYMYLFEFNGTAIIGASPETLMTVYNKKVITNPIAGTCPRGSTPEEDEQLAREMLNDEKERAEHVMLVDLGRNDVRMVCRSGSVKVDDFMSVLKYSHVQHIESTVSGILREECDQFDATRAIFPAGTLSGAPKIRAMEIIDDLETGARGLYGGGVGYYSINGDADFAIVIRTVIMKEGKAYIQAGAGIVADSDPAREYHETERKMAAMMKVLSL